MGNWVNELRENAGSRIKMVLIGNKSDLGDQRVVSTENVANFAEKNGLSFMETSALDATNVAEAFQLLIDG